MFFLHNLATTIGSWSTGIVAVKKMGSLAATDIPHTDYNSKEWHFKIDWQNSS